MTLIKICGLSTPATLAAAISAGADQIGLVFFPKSPRHVSLHQACALADQARGRVEVVALTVDATDADLEAIMAAARPDWLQLHGQESPARVNAVRARTGRSVMKAIGIASREDLAAAGPYAAVADRLLFDAKPPRNATLPGGNGVAFDWTVLSEVKQPFILSGGLAPGTVAEAIRVCGAFGVDVSSGVETAPGVKDLDAIAAFIRAVRAN